MRAYSLGLLVMWVGCGGGSGPTDAPRSDGAGGLDGATVDGGAGLDAAGLDAAGLDADSMGTDAALADAPPGDGGEPDGGLVSMPCTATGACDPFDPSSCPSGNSCRLGAMGTECMALASSPAAVGEACTRTDSCVAGSLCLDFGGGFLCHAMCPEGSIGACAEGFGCSGNLGDACVRVCRPLAPRCDIYAQDCVDPALACTLVTHPETGERYTGCRPPGTLTRGETCGGGAGTCVEGLICIRIAGVSTCRDVCSTDAGGPSCTAPQTCTGTTTGWGVHYCDDPP